MSRTPIHAAGTPADPPHPPPGITSTSAAAVHQCARHWLARGIATIDVQVVAHQGSVPREADTHMLVSRDAVAGTIGGGHLELQAIAAAREQLHHGRQDPLDLRYALGPSLGQCCGGAVALRLQPLTLEGLTLWKRPADRFVLQLYGAGHVGRAIVRLLADLPCRVRWIDERASEFPTEALPEHIERLCVEPVEAEVASAPLGAHHLVLTHSHDLDLRLVDAILRRGDFAWCGVIGSATKRARFEHRLLARGHAPETVARLTCPIGLPGLSGKEPAVIAIAVVAQWLQSSPPPALVV